jgi:hypothetical protein
MRTLLVILFALTGCAAQQPRIWLHPHENQAIFQKDVAQCNYEAAKATGSYVPDTSGYRTLLVQDLSAAVDIDNRQTKIKALCMKARGYSLK